MARWRRRLLRAVAALLGLLGAVVLAALLFASSSRGEALIHDQLLALLRGALAPGWTVDDVRLEVGARGRVTVRHLVLRDPAGAEVIAARAADVDLDLLRLLVGQVRAQHVSVRDVDLAIDLDADGIANVARAFGVTGPPATPAVPWEGLPITLLVDDVDLSDVRVAVRTPDAEGRLATVFAAKVLALRADRVRLPRGRPEVRADGLDLAAVLLRPGPLPVLVAGSGRWGLDGVGADGLAVRVLDNRLVLDGHLDDLHGRGDGDLVLTVERVDLGLVHDLLDAPVKGVFQGSFGASGPLAALGLTGHLEGVGDTSGGLTIGAGTLLCLPVVDDAADRCSVPIEAAPPAVLPRFGTTDALRWRADVAVDGFDLVDVLPDLKGPLAIAAHVRALGRGTRWPDDVVVDGTLEAGPADVFGVTVGATRAGVHLEGGKLAVTGLDATSSVASVKADATVDLVGGALSADATGTFDLAGLAVIGATDLAGKGTFRAAVSGDVLGEKPRIVITGDADAAPVAWAQNIVVDTIRAPFELTVDGADVDIHAGAVATGVLLYGVKARRVAADGVTVTVRDEGRRVAVRAAVAHVSDFDAYGVRTKEGSVEDLAVDIPVNETVDIRSGAVALQGFDAYGILARTAEVAGFTMAAAPDGAFGMRSGPATLYGLDAYGITAETARTTELTVDVAGPNDPIDVVVTGGDVRGANAYGIEASRASVPRLDVTAVPGGDTEVVIPRTDLAELDAYGIEADRAGAGASDAVSAAGAELLPPAVAGVVAPLLGLGRLEVHVAMDGETDVMLGQVGLQGVSYYGVVAPVALVERVDVHVTKEGDATIHGRAVAATAARADIDTSLDDLEVTFDVVAPEVGDYTIDIDAQIGGHRLFGLEGDHGGARMHILGDLLTGDIALWRRGETWAVAEGMSLDLVTQALGVQRFELRPSWRQHWVSDGPMAVTIGEDGVSDAHVVLASDLGRIALDGTAGLSGPLDAHVALDHLQLDALAELWPIKLAGIDGEVSLDLALAGTADHPAVHARIDGDDLFVEDQLRWLDVRGTIDVLDDVLDADLALGVGADALGRVSGRAPLHVDLERVALLSEGAADLRVVVEPGALERFEHLLPWLDLPAGAASGLLHVLGDLRDPQLQLQAVVEAEPVANEPLRVELDVSRVEDTLRLEADVYRAYAPILLVSGSARTRIGEVLGWLVGGEARPAFDDPSLYVRDIQVGAQLQELPVPLLRKLAGVDVDLDGALSGTVALAGDPLRPELRVDLQGPVTLAEVGGDIALKLGPGVDGYDLALSLGHDDDTWLTAQGRVPLSIDLAQPLERWATTTWDLHVGGDGIPLGVLGAVDAGLVAESGRLVVTGGVKGALASPNPDLTLKIDGGEVQLLPVGLRVRDLQLDGALDVDAEGHLQVRVGRLAAVTRPMGATLQELAQPGASRIELRAMVALDGIFPSTVRGEVALDNAWLVALDRSTLRASGNLQVRGTWPDLRAVGDLSVDQGRFELNVAELAQPSAIEVDTAITVHRAGASYQRQVEVAEPGFLEHFDADVRLDLGRNANLILRVPLIGAFGAFGAAVTRADVAARLGGQLHVTMSQGDPSIVGAVEALAGQVNVLRGRFDLRSGSTITFFGGDYANPQLDIKGAMTVTGGQIDLSLLGPAMSPTFTLNSDTWGNDVATLFTILLTGRAPDDLTSNQGRAALEAAGNLLLSSVLGNVSLGSVAVDATGTVRVGIPVYRTVFVETVYNPTARLNENTITVQLEWSILPKLLLQAAYGNRRIFGNLVYELRLTTLCDRARDAFKHLPGSNELESVEASCKVIRRRVEEAGGIDAIRAAVRAQRPAGARTELPPEAPPETEPPP